MHVTFTWTTVKPNELPSTGHKYGHIADPSHVQQEPHSARLMVVLLEQSLVHVRDKRSSLAAHCNVRHPEITDCCHSTPPSNDSWVSDLQSGGDRVAMETLWLWEVVDGLPVSGGMDSGG